MYSEAGGPCTWFEGNGVLNQIKFRRYNEGHTNVPVICSFRGTRSNKCGWGAPESYFWFYMRVIGGNRRLLISQNSFVMAFLLITQKARTPGVVGKLTTPGELGFSQSMGTEPPAEYHDQITENPKMLVSHGEALKVA